MRREASERGHRSSGFRRTGRTVRRLLRWAVPVLAIGLGPQGAGPRGAEGGTADDLTVGLSRDAVVKLLEAALPYQLEIKTGLFKQVVTLKDPREVRLFSGGATLRLTATGQPIPFTSTLDPEIRVVPLGGEAGFRIEARKMTVSMGRLGSVDLASVLEPILVPALTSTVLEGAMRPIPIDLVLKAIDIETDGLRLRFAARFPAPPAGGKGGAGSAGSQGPP